MFNLIPKIKQSDIYRPKTHMCICGHRWSWHYIASNNHKCYAHKIIESDECICKGYKE